MILDKKVSVFKNTRSISVIGEISVETVLERIKSGTYKKTVDKIRSGDSELKKELPTIAMHGLFEHARKKKDFYESSGLIILDIDDVEKENIQDIKQNIMDSSDHVLSAMTSPSGDGIKILYHVAPELITADNYRQIGKIVINNFSEYGHVDYLSVTDCLIMTYDPDILINENCSPDVVYIEDTGSIKSELEPLDETRELWDDPEDFFDTVLASDIEQKTNNNFHYIQVAILDLAKFGFRHPNEDLSFVIHYAEAAFKHSRENERRFQEVVEIAKNYPQTQWPYRFTPNDDFEPDDEYIDYDDLLDESSDPTEKKASPQKKKRETDSEKSFDEDLTDDDDLSFKPEDLFDKVVETINEGPRVGREVSFKNFANALRFKGTGVLTVTGIPSHGKTEMVDAITEDLARLYDEGTHVVGFEQTAPEHIVKLIRRMAGVDIRCQTWRNKPENLVLLKEYYNFITDHFTHIDTDKTGGNINMILRALAVSINKKRKAGKNPRYVVIDPFNMLSIKGRFSGHEKIEEILRRLTHFSHRMDVLVILVAHPFKMKKDEKTGNYEIPDFYSVKGSSAFYEMSYHGFVVYREIDRVLVRILKVKQNNLGKKDVDIYFEYELNSGRYIPVDEVGNEMEGDHRDKNWLQKALNKKTQDE